ncbi:LemA family protein [Candidatus Microgenomates bacterium]|nr:LemA family protein [Candidatus Microgenomates bacterium]
MLPVLGLAAVVVIYIWSLYNGLVTIRMRVKEAWSGIDVQLKRRADLIPNLVETVKGYAKHEKGVFENVTKARSALLSAKTPAAKGEANAGLTGTLKTLFAVAENYPELKANENFKDLQKQLEDTEDKVAYARQFYNTNVLEYNTKIKVFPNVLLAQNFGFKKEEFFEAGEEERKKVEVKF